MNKDGYYSSGQFAKLAHVSVRTIRFYDQKGLLKPSFLTESGARFYTDYDLAKLQQILLLKYLGFSLDDIKDMPTGQSDNYFLKNALTLQKKLIQERIEEMRQVENAIDATLNELKDYTVPDWKSMLDIIHLTAMENTLKNQYQNSSNIVARIRLHEDYSVNKQGWFNWIYEKCEIKKDMKILELGCGNGALWLDNLEDFYASDIENVQIVLSDISAGIIRDAKRSIEEKQKYISKSKQVDLKKCDFKYKAFDCAKIPYEDNSYDLVIANHVLFYCDDIDKVCKEISRVLKPNGVFICSTYSKNHMKEIRKLVQKFDDRIILSGEKLYEKFGLENGKEILERSFKNVELEKYEDEIVINEVNPLIEYILSCHGNQNQYLLDRYNEFRTYLNKLTSKPFHISKDVGIYICKQE